MNLLKQTAAQLSIFILGIILIAFGVALTAKASLGNSPISAIPYSLSLCLPEITFGIWVILFNLLMVAIECILLFRKIISLVHDKPSITLEEIKIHFNKICHTSVVHRTLVRLGITYKKILRASEQEREDIKKNVTSGETGLPHVK